MPQLSNAVSGVTVSVSDETAARLGSEWVEVKPEPTAKKSKS